MTLSSYCLGKPRLKSLVHALKAFPNATAYQVFMLYLEVQ